MVARLEGLKERIKAVLQLPACAIQEVTSRLGLIDREERDYRALHEAGHAAVFFLADKPIVKVEISHLRGMTTCYLNTALKGVLTVKAGEVNSTPEEERAFAAEHPDRNTLMYLAGISSTQDPKHADYFNHIIDEQLTLGRDATWDDIGVPYAYLAERFAAIHNREPEPQEVKNLFYDLYGQMKEVFVDPKFAKMLQIITEQIKKRELRGDINAKIKACLESNGLSLSDYEEMQKRLFSIDVDQLIRNPSVQHGQKRNI